MNNRTLSIIALVGVISLSGLTFLLSNANSNDTISPSPSPTTTVNHPADALSAREVVLKTSKGDIRLSLFPDDAPLAVENFVTLGKRGYYNGVIFHRVIKDFMDQAGDPTGTGMGGESIFGQYFKTEINSREFKAGVLGAARTNTMDTNGSQFFIMAADNFQLNNQYTVFGQVADEVSLAVVKAINIVPTDSNDKPLEAVTITSFEITQ